MKKTISINISGVIFHIEEDGYEKLKGYLSSIQQYFSTYEDSQEIVTDIENRIAEKLLKTLKGDEKNPARQAVTIDDVNGLIAQMGTVADFEAVDNDDMLVASGSRAKTGTAAPTTPPRPNATGAGTFDDEPASGSQSSQRGYEYDYKYDPTTGKARTSYSYNGRKLARDLRRKTLGGVAAGLAHYFRIDPVWMRVLIVCLVVGFPAIGDGFMHGNGRFGSLGGVTVIAYILLWIFLPGETTLEEEKGVKKFYRNPDNKVLGGVASGLAVYFGLDAGVVRFALVASVFLFGFGILAYIILWMVAPEARTLTQKMEMAGQPITLSNIEHSVKSSLNISETVPEGGFTQLLLFPFRALAAVFRVIGRLLGGTLRGLGSVLRILFGLIMVCMGIGFMITCLVFLGFGIGIFNGVHFGPGSSDPVWVSLLHEDGNFLTLLAGFGVCFIPSLGLALTGLLVMTRRALISSSTGLSLLGAWVVCAVMLAVTIPQTVREFSKNGTVENTQVINPAGTPTFVMDNADEEDGLRPNIDLQGYAGTDIKVVTVATARGRSRRDAQTQAQLVQYKPLVTDSLVKFSREFLLPDNAKFRGQSLNVTVYIPYGRAFRMSNDAAHFIQNRFDDKEFDNIANKRWQFLETGLVGIGFERTLDKEDTSSRQNDEGDANGTDDVDVDTDGSETKTLELGPNSPANTPTTVTVSGNFAVRFQKGNQLKAVVDGNGQEQLANVSHTNEDGTLRIEQRGNDLGPRMGITITLPTVETLRLSGGAVARMTEFDALDKLTVDLSGDSQVLVKTNVKTLVTDQTGAAKIILRGQADKVTATLSGASKLNARQMRVETANVSTTGASRASFDEVKNLSKNSSGSSQIDSRNGGE
ncbi:PspC domain-containing protein [Fibrella aquatilis]|uniref:PspC domain-containing protein n=1 Tax=Fibrella aquatilis TaxID=2817059 RepID=A0A939GDP8_9BACT|nr:PspC domain-containing protein [Fibrella aquatilis]MBO0934806.1 PspC domain-containing protein [Fibrella aquatilis]